MYSVCQKSKHTIRSQKEACLLYNLLHVYERSMKKNNKIKYFHIDSTLQTNRNVSLPGVASLFCHLVEITSSLLQ